MGQGAARPLARARPRFGSRLTRRYDAVHSHEEGGPIGVVLATMLRVPHLYDMHSSLPQQVANFGYSARGCSRTAWAGSSGS